MLLAIVAADPRVFLTNPNDAPPDAVIEDARRALDAGPFSVLQKGLVPPSGDKHDYMSQAPYWWPNPRTPDGLPYIRRDGERNPEVNKLTDHANMDRVARDSRALALAYFRTKDEIYAERAALLLRAWFLDPATRMRPNLNFAQAIRGVNDGRGTGIIESRGLTGAVDAAGLLAGSKNWTEADQRGLEEWFAGYLGWLQTSENGRDESKAQNNHGTFYDVQVADFALFTGRRDLAVRTLNEAKSRRIAAQIEPDGRQPKETARTRGLSYSVMNLDGLMQLAALGDAAGVDLWNFQTRDERGIRKALEWLIPYAGGEKKWPYEQIEPFRRADFAPLLRRAARAYHDSQYAELAAKLEER
jgi:hypothetical protein